MKVFRSILITAAAFFVVSIVLQTELAKNWSRMVVLGIAASIYFVMDMGVYALEGWLGRGQWPNPHGRHYEEWLFRNDGNQDYYAWLAERMGNRKPRSIWAERERQVRIRPT